MNDESKKNIGLSINLDDLGETRKSASGKPEDISPESSLPSEGVSQRPLSPLGVSLAIGQAGTVRPMKLQKAEEKMPVGDGVPPRAQTGDSGKPHQEEPSVAGAQADDSSSAPSSSSPWASYASSGLPHDSDRVEPNDAAHASHSYNRMSETTMQNNMNLGAAGSSPLSDEKIDLWSEKDGFGQAAAGSAKNTVYPPYPPYPPYFFQPEKPWRKRHPFLFWGGIIVILLIVLNLSYGAYLESPASGAKVAVVNVEGMIIDGKSTIEYIEKVSRDPSVAGVLLRVNSPGGVVAPSQEIFFAVERLSRRKPVVVSMGTVAASGGYYISLPAKRIFAVPSTLTASIGVKMEVPNLEGLMKTLGIASTTLASGDLKDAGSPYRPMTEKEEAYLKSIIDDMYSDFIENVAKYRKMTLDDVKKVANGAALTGRQALEAGLIDEFGDRQVALNYLFRELGLSPAETRVVEGPPKKNALMEDLFETFLRISVEQKAHAEQVRFFY